MNYSVEIMEIATEHTIDHEVNKHPNIFLNNPRNEKYIMVVLCFASPVEVLTKDGLERGEPGDCILVTPAFPEYHRTWPGEKKGFINDWVWVNVKNPSEMNALDPPVNTLIHTRDPMFLRKYLETLGDELLHRDVHYELVVSQIIERMLVDLSRVYNSRYDAYINSDYKSQLLKLRQHIQSTIHEQWTVNRMADEIGLSTSRFSVIYRKQFNNSPMEDVIEMRVSEAKRLLVSTQFTVRQISVLCGLKNEYYFSRFFKGQTGVTPSTYRGIQKR